jgi:hypothetical protein
LKQKRRDFTSNKSGFHQENDVGLRSKTGDFIKHVDFNSKKFGIYHGCIPPHCDVTVHDCKWKLLRVTLQQHVLAVSHPIAYGQFYLVCLMIKNGF